MSSLLGVRQALRKGGGGWNGKRRGHGYLDGSGGGGWWCIADDKELQHIWFAS